tara:strand:- start:73 stop:513 length:441 start_codon:yes stop_codon:yes gene_type:complete
MNTEVLGIVVGGLLPAFFFAFSGVFTKASTNTGIGIGIYTIILGLAVVLVGLLTYGFFPDKTLSVRSGTQAFFAGFVWAFGSILIFIGLSHYHLPLSRVAGLVGTNTLIGALLALWIFSEWKQVQVPQLLIGTMLVVVGGVLVARA